MASSLVTQIDDIIMRTADRERKVFQTYEELELSIGLRTLKVLLLLRKPEQLRTLKLSNSLRKWDSMDGLEGIALLFFKIRRLLLRRLFLRGKGTGYDMLREVLSLGKEVDDALWNRLSHSSLLTVDEVLGIAHVVLDNAVDLLNMSMPFRFYFRVPTEAMDAFRLHMLMMRNFLHFAVQTGVELVTVLFHIKPIAINAARVFITGGSSDCHRDMESFCLAVNRMAADPQVYQAYSQALAAASTLLAEAPFLPVDHGVLKNFLASLISLLWDVLRHSLSDSRSEHSLKALYERLRFTRSTLKNCKDDKIMVQIGVLTCDVGVFIYSPYHTDLGRLSDLLQRFDVLQAQVELGTNPSKANEELTFGSFTNLNISDGDGGKEFNTSTPISTHRPPLSSITPPTDGFQLDEVNSILDRLIGGSKQLRIVQISGMAGIGKTTFALQLYNHPSVMQYFWARAWCPISQALDKKKVLLQLLNQIHESESHSKMSEEDLADRLRKSLKGKRYLILLDDVWTPEVWNSLKASFPNDSTGSRIILTSRNVVIADRALLDEQPYSLRLRDNNESLQILKAKLIRKEGWNFDVGMKIAEKCKGLPLTLCIVAGALATTDQEGWKGIMDRLGSGAAGAESALELSYEHLPDYLQPCLLYFGAFPEDGDIYVTRLIRLWMAEGFVQENDLRMEDVAREYMTKLIESSLVMVVENRWKGGAKTCRIHDLVRDFCLIQAKKEGFFHLLQERHDELSDFNEPCNLQRLVIHSATLYFKDSGLFCPRAQSLVFFPTPGSSAALLLDMSFIFQIFQLLKVLDIIQTETENGIPSEIDRLTRLRYLSIWSKVPVIPSSVSNLYNLETFNARFPSSEISYPHTLWNLRKLKYLRIKTFEFDFDLLAEDLENSSSLRELVALSGVVFHSDGSMEELIRKFPNIRRLNCVILPRAQSREAFLKIRFPEFRNQLESLTFRGSYIVKYVFGSFPESLRKLRLFGFELSKEEIAVIGKLPNLEVLKLHYNHFPEKRLDMEEGFPKLRILELWDINSELERWTSFSDDQLPCLEKLIFWYCEILKEIPSCLEISTTLEEIQVYRCSSTLESLVRDVEEVQKDFGNLIKVHVSS